MTAGLLAWVFVLSTLAALFFSTLSYALRTISRVQLEEALIVRRRTRAFYTVMYPLVRESVHRLVDENPTRGSRLFISGWPVNQQQFAI